MAGDHVVTEQLGVELSGRRIALERLRAQHVSQLHGIAQSPEWPLAGRGLDVQAFGDFLWSSMEICFSMVRRDSGDVIGFVAGTGWDRRSRTIEVTFGIAPSEWNTLWPFEGVLIFCDYLFTGVGLRKLYFSLRESTMAKLGSGVSRWLTKECVYSDHVRTEDGGFEDVQLWSLSEWDPGVVDRIAGRRAS